MTSPDCKGCEQCAHTHGDQAEDEEGRELIRLRAENAELRREIERRDELLQGSSPAAIAELVASGMDAEREELRREVGRQAAELDRLSDELEDTHVELVEAATSRDAGFAEAERARKERDDLADHAWDGAEELTIAVRNLTREQDAQLVSDLADAADCACCAGSLDKADAAIRARK